MLCSTEIVSSSCNLIMLPNRITVLLGFLTFFSVYAPCQDLNLVREVNVPHPVTNVSTDQKGNLYVSTARGQLIKYNPNGDSLLTFSPKKNGAITLVEGWTGLKIFVFYRDFQEFVLLDHFLRPSPNYSFNTREVGFVELATISGDKNVWLLDQSDISLKKYDINTNSLIVSTPVDLILAREDHNIVFLKECQNMVIMADEKLGLFLFDNMGNYRSRLNVLDVNYFNFQNDELYFLRSGHLIFLNLYTGKSRAIPLPPEKQFTFAILIPQHVVLFTENSFGFYEIRD